ncbi:hypothetical protein AVEN_71638-1 [Araneus ventricosus]|uniref:Uncharacterized protein n=1 Tax=Araneus ventricosus TaxID=182803 RepID=A0A4Y2KIF2_ARAVE|nr:hypothetical protein AVEN_71638-1 [Araneus ventricosus]
MAAVHKTPPAKQKVKVAALKKRREHYARCLTAISTPQLIFHPHHSLLFICLPSSTLTFHLRETLEEAWKEKKQWRAVSLI